MSQLNKPTSPKESDAAPKPAPVTPVTPPLEHPPALPSPLPECF